MSVIVHFAMVRHKNKDKIAIMSPYNKLYVDNIKSIVAPSHREWNVDNKIWLISPGRSQFLSLVDGAIKIYGWMNICNNDLVAIDSILSLWDSDLKCPIWSSINLKFITGLTNRVDPIKKPEAIIKLPGRIVEID